VFHQGRELLGYPCIAPVWEHQIGIGLQIEIFLDILLDIFGGLTMSNSQKRALRNYRQRLIMRGMARFEVLGLRADRELIRSLARRLATNDQQAWLIRRAVGHTIAGERVKRGGILAALRRSPLVGAELQLTRPVVQGRTVDL